MRRGERYAVLTLAATEKTMATVMVRPQMTTPAQVGVLVLLRALDSLEQRLVLFDRMGRIHHASQAYQQDIQGSEVHAQITQYAQATWALAPMAALGAAVRPATERQLVTARGEYAVQATYIGIDLFGCGPTVLVAVQPPAPDPLDGAVLNRRFGLSKAQARVARLLADGLRNQEIAEKLFVSPHTVRHHIEQIRMKVGGHTRAATAALLRGAH